MQPIRLMDEAPFTLGGVTVTPAARTLAAGGRESVIEPRVMQVLVTLHRQPGAVVGREALIDACWDGRAVGEDAVNRAILKLRRALDEIGGGVAVETVAKVGYRLRAAAPAPSADPPPPRRSKLRWLLPGAGLAAALAAGAMLLAGAPAGPPPSRVVLVQPLRVAAADAPARRLSQDFTSDLSRAVLGHDGRLEFADARGATGQAATFTLAGSVASVGQDLHAVVTLARRDDPAILWSHDYTAPLADADGLHQQVSTNVAAVLVCALGVEGVPEPVDAQTTALYLETCSLHAGDHHRESYLLRQVTERAPRFAGGWTDLAISLAFASADADAEAIPAMRRESEAAARRALSLDPHMGRAYFAQALLLPGLRNWTARERLMDAGLKAQPDCPQLHNIRARDLAAIGRQEDGIASDRRAVALDPLYPGKTASLARALADAGRLDEANGIIRHMREVWPDNDYTVRVQFETAARTGDAREAAAMLESMRGRFLGADEIAAWRIFLRARAAPTPENVRRAVASLSDDRRRGAVSDADFVEQLALLGRPDAALAVALRLPAQPDTSFWFRSFLQPLRADPRFMAVAQRQGLYPVWRATNLWPDFCSAKALRYDCRAALPASRQAGL